MPETRTMPATVKTVWLLPVFTGIFLSLSTATVDVGLFAWIGLVPLFFFLAHPSTTARTAALGGLAAGTAYGLAVLWPLLTLNAWWWVAPNSFWLAHREILLAGVIAALAIVGGGGFFCLFSALYWKFHQNTAIDAVVFPFLWMVFERGRELIVYGFTWGHLGYNVHDYTLALQPAKLFGVYAVSGTVVAANMLVYLALRRRDARRFYIVLLTTCTVALLAGGYVSMRAGERDLNDTLPVAVMHSPLSTAESASFSAYESQLAALEDALANNPTVVVLPENVFPFFVINQETGLPHMYEFEEVPIRKMFDRLASISAAHPDTAIVLGLHTSDGEQRFNSLIVMEGGAVSSMYSKRVLLPLAERVPERFSKHHVEPITRGSSTTIAIRGNVPITPLICSEIIYPRAAARTPKSIIVNISNDGIFESSIAAKQHHIMAKLRAVERDAYLLRSTKRGISSVIDPSGRTLVFTRTNEHTVLATRIPR